MQPKHIIILALSGVFLLILGVIFILIGRSFETTSTTLLQETTAYSTPVARTTQARPATLTTPSTTQVSFAETPVQFASSPRVESTQTTNIDLFPTASATLPPTALLTTPTATNTPPVIFAVIGDFGDPGRGAQDVAALVDSWNPDFIITVGDNNYPVGAAETIDANVTQHYGTYIAANRFFPTLGNHDYYTDLAQPYFDYFELPGNERYYDFVWGDVHLLALNSDWNEPDGIGVNSVQAQWLQSKLIASESAWQVVYFHVPPYASRAESMVPALRWPFAAWGADLVLTGHAHVYERLQIDGIPYVINGVGGHSIYGFDDVPHSASQVRFNRDFGAVRIQVDAQQLHLQFITRAVVLVDEFTLLR